MKIATLRRGVVGGALALLLVTIISPIPRAEAATYAELQAQIQTLLTQITQLQAQLHAMQGGGLLCTVPPSYLTMGSRGADVVALQNFLIKRGYVIPAGATGYFGTQTQSALRLFQANQGISPALGYNYGPQTRARVQALCTPAPSPSPTPQPTPQPTPTPTPSPSLSGEASIERFTVRDGKDTDLEEGDEKAEIMEISFRVRDGDAELNRLEIGVTPDEGNDEDDPWDTFDSVSVWSDGKRLATVDASDKDTWYEDSPRTGDYLLRLSGIDYFLREDKQYDLTVAVDVQGNIRGTSDGESWTVFVPDDGLRALDADNAAVYAGDTADAVTLNLDQAGASDELIVRRSDDDPDASVLRLDDNRNSGYIEVFAFDLDTDDSRNDIEIRSIPIELTFSDGTLNTFIRNARLIVDGKSFTDETITGTSTGFLTFDIDRNDLVIDRGDRVTAVLEIDFKALDETYEGTTLVAHIDADDIEAEGTDDLVGNQLQGAAWGEMHSLYTRGSAAEDSSTSAEVKSITGANNDYASFQVTVDFTAFGQDVYIPANTSAVTYEIQSLSGGAASSTSSTVVSSTADERGGYFYLPEGETERFILQVIYRPNAPMVNARLQLLSVHYNDTPAAPDQIWSALPSTTYRTPLVVIVD